MVFQFMLDPDPIPVPEPDPELIQDDGDTVKEDAVITGEGELEQNKTTSEKCGPRLICYYAINLFISWELMPIDYGKIRVLNVTKSAKRRAENLGVTV